MNTKMIATTTASLLLSAFLITAQEPSMPPGPVAKQRAKRPYDRESRLLA